ETPTATISAEERAIARTVFGISPSAVVLLAIANHRPQKRLEHLPAILAAVRSRGIAAHLLLVGEPVRSDPSSLGIERRIEDEAARRGLAALLTLAASRKDVAGAYAAAGVVLSTSAFEGLSLVYREALARGLPVVTTPVAGVEELAKKHEQLRTVDM